MPGPTLAGATFPVVIMFARAYTGLGTFPVVIMFARAYTGWGNISSSDYACQGLRCEGVSVTSRGRGEKTVVNSSPESVDTDPSKSVRVVSSFNLNEPST